MSALVPAAAAVSHSTTRLVRVVAQIRGWWCLLAIAIVWPFLWTFAFETTPGRRYEHFATYRFDLGNMTQAVWSTAHGRPLEVTLASGEQASRLGVHVDPILALLAPLWWIFPTALLLVVIQAVAIASGSLAVYLLSHRVLDSPIAALLLGLAYLMYPWIIWQAHSELHPVALALPAFLWAVWFLTARRYVGFCVAVGLALLCGELIGLALAGLGVWHALRTRNWRLGAAITAVGIGWTAVCLWIIIPAFSGGSSTFYDRYASVGGSPGGIARTAVTDPGAILSAGASTMDIAYTAALLAPLAGFFAWAPMALLAAAPQLALNVLSDWPSTTSPSSHYVSVIVPFLFVATIFGLARFATRRRRVIGASVVLATCTATALMFAPWPGLLLASDYGRVAGLHLQNTGRAAVRNAIALVPDDAGVSATNRIAGRLSARRYVYSAPVIGRATWVVVDRTDGWIPKIGDGREGVDHERIDAFRRRLQEDPAWVTVYSRDDVTVFRKRDASRPA